MRIGIDVSQTAYGNTGVGNYLSDLVRELIKNDEHEFVLFFSSLRGNFQFSIFNFQSNHNVSIKKFRIPPIILDWIWNKLHVAPIEWFVGDVDLFITSDWTEPPVRKAKKATIIYDLIAYKYPEETHNQTEFRLNKLNISSNIVQIQKKKLDRVKKESDIVFCISESTKRDIVEILKIDSSKIKVIYPGL